MTLVGQRAMAAMREAKERGESDPLDWRRAREVEWTPWELPVGITRRCVALTERLGLGFSGIDLVLDDRGQYWFLESNPNGEWGWLQRAGLPIAEALAEALT